LATSQTIFTRQVFAVCAQQMESYFQVFLQDPTSVKAEPANLKAELGYSEILGHKRADRTTIEFT